MKVKAIYLLSSVVALSFVLNSCTKDIPDRFIEPGITSDSTNHFVDEIRLQNSWTYDQMKNDYLWANDIPDVSLLQLNDNPQTFFSKLLHKDDRFSWMEVNQTYQGTSSLYDKFGIEIQKYSDIKGDTISRIIWINRDSEAYQYGLRRGSWVRIKNIDSGVLTLSTGKLENARFVSAANTITLLSANSQTGSVVMDSIYTLNGQSIGYFVYNQFNDAGSALNNPYRSELRSIIASFKAAQISELIIDLRYNPGGYVSVCQFLCGLLLPDRYLGSLSGFHSFNTRRAKIQFEMTQKEEQELFFPNKSIIGSDNIDLPRIHFIVSKRTASASESLINNLSPFVETILIGVKTTGKGVGSWTIQSSLYKWQLQPITFRYYNKNHVTVPDTGLEPDIYVDDTNSSEIYDIGDVRELLLSAALENIFGKSRTRSTYSTPSLTLKPVESLSNERRNVSGYIMEQ